MSLYISFANEVYRDRVDLRPSEFYRKLANGPVFPTTSAPSPGDFAQIYDQLAAETSEVLSIHLPSKFRATFDAALQGREQRKNKRCRIRLVDSPTVVMALGLIVIAAAEEAQEGKNLIQIEEMVRKDLAKAHLQGTFDTLEYLRRGGRIGRAAALLGSTLKLNPILTMSHGAIEPAGRERSRAKAIEHLYNFTKSFSGRIRKLAVEYADYGTTPQEAEALLQRLQPLLPSGERVYESQVSPVIGTHTGPGLILVSILEA